MVVKTGMPDWLEPMAATLTQDRFSGGDWVFERKFDGIRLLAYKRGTDVQLYSRNRLLQNVPPVADAIAQLPVDEAIFDGEITWDPPSPGGYGEGGLQSGYHVFDILWLNGRSLTSLPLEERQRLLQALPLKPPLRRVELLDDDDPWDRARREGWEGVIAKRRGSPYEHRRSKLWLKMKCEASQEFVVGGFTEPEGSREGVGAILVGYYEGESLRFAGKVGTGRGWNDAFGRRLRELLEPLEIDVTPFDPALPRPLSRLAHWVEPRLVAEVQFAEWTGDGKIRHPSLQGFRADKRPTDVRREFAE